MSLSPASSLAGMLSYVTGGYFSHYSTFYWCYREWYFPLTLWALAGIIYHRSSLKYFLALCLGAGLSMSMDVEKAFYMLWFYLGWVIYSAPAGQRIKKTLIATLGLGMGFTLLGFAPLINTAGFFPHSIRSQGISFQGFLINQLPASSLLIGFIPTQISLINPLWHFYLGLSAFILAIFGIKRLGKKAILSIIALLLYTLYSMGEPHFLKLFYHLPVFNHTVLHYGAITAIFIIFSGWTAFGMAEIISKPRPRWLMMFLLVVIFIIMAIDIFGLKTGRVNVLLFLGRNSLHAWTIALMKSWFRPIFLFMLFSAGLLIFIKFKIISENIIKVFIIFFIIFDLSFFALSTRPSARKVLLEPGAKLKDIMRNNGFNRFYPVSNKALEDLELVPMMGMQIDPLVPGAHTPLGYMRLLPRRITDLMNIITPGCVRYDQAGKLIKLDLTKPLLLNKIDPKTDKLLSLLNVGIIISRGIKLDTEWRATQAGDFTIYQNPSYLPRAFLLGKIQREKSPTKQLQTLISDEFDPSKTAIVSDDFPEFINSDSRGSVRLLQFRPGYWKFQTLVTGDSPELFFISEAYYPGWRAYLDRREEKIARVNYAFMGLSVPHGKHTLTLKLDPPVFRLGVWTSLVSYVVIALIIFQRKFKRSLKI